MAGTLWYSATVPLVLSNSCPYFSLSLSFWLFFSLGAFVDTYRLRPSICFYTCLPCSLQVVSLTFSPLLFILSVCFGKNEFPGLLCFSNFSSFVQVSLLVCHLLCSSLLCVFWDETYCPLHSLSLRLYHFPCLPSYLSPTCLLILSPLSCFFPGLQHLRWRGKRFSSFLSFLTCSSSLSQCFFTFLLITVILSGCFWDPRFSLSPMCSPLCPYWANFLLLAVSV